MEVSCRTYVFEKRQQNCPILRIIIIFVEIIRIKTTKVAKEINVS